jgi:hypothetical protein
MSNTFQSLVTAIDVKDIPDMLQRDGDSKVGTNSPFAINRRSHGKVGAWMAWTLLIATSLVSCVAALDNGISSSLLNSPSTYLQTHSSDCLILFLQRKLNTMRCSCNPQTRRKVPEASSVGQRSEQIQCGGGMTMFRPNILRKGR